MTNNNKTNLIALKGMNLSLNDMNSSVSVRNSSVNDMNSSFISGSINMLAEPEKIIKYLPIITHKKNDVTPVITHLFDFSDSEKQGFTSHDNKRYYSGTTNCSAVKPSRHPLAIFMSKICLTNYQRFTNDINTNISALQTSHKYSTDTIGANIYDGLSGLNKIPLVGNKPRRLNTVVNNLSPSFFAGGNKLTNCSGAIHHG